MNSILPLKIDRVWFKSAEEIHHKMTNFLHHYEYQNSGLNSDDIKKLIDRNQPIVKDQTFFEALKEAFTHKGYLLLNAGFFVCGFQITLIATHIPGYMQERGMGGWSATIILALIIIFIFSS